MDDHEKTASARSILMPASALRGKRWDPGYWLADRPTEADAAALPRVPLGSFIETICYGAILPGRRPEPVRDGVAIVGQREVRPTGVVLDRAIRVAEGCAYDPSRCRLRPGDVVLARSGVGALGKKLFTVFRNPVRATVSCFVDLVRLQGISPFYVVTFLRSRMGWSQVERLMSGVGTPNLSFSQVRSLLVPVLPAAEQQEIEAAWAGIGQLHDAGRLAESTRALDSLVADLETRLARRGSQAV